LLLGYLEIVLVHPKILFGGENGCRIEVGVKGGTNIKEIETSLIRFLKVGKKILRPDTLIRCVPSAEDCG
jgi:hypothetical protein